MRATENHPLPESAVLALVFGDAGRSIVAVYTLQGVIESFASEDTSSSIGLLADNLPREIAVAYKMIQLDNKLYRL